MLVHKYIIWLVLYGFLGWVYESLLCSFKQKKVINRGFLNGPYCPIYGFGAVADILILGRIKNPLALFFAGAALTCAIEYFTSWALEKLFHAKWWDYSGRKFQLGGRVCLLGAVVFGLFSVALIKLIHPYVESATEGLPIVVVYVLPYLLISAMLTDCAYTVVHMTQFNSRLKEAHSKLSLFMREPLAVTEEIKKTIGENLKNTRFAEHMKEIAQKLSRQELRFLNDFPKFSSTRYGEAFQKIREIISSKK